MFLGIDMGFWYGMIAVAAATLVGVLVAWILPPKKEEVRNEQNQQQSEKEEESYF